MISLVVSLVFLIFGLLRKVPEGILFLIILPIAGAFGQWVIFKGIFVYDFFFMGLICSYIPIWISRGINIKINLLFVFILLIYGLFSLFQNSINSNFLRELRPGILIIEAFVLFNVKKSISQKNALNIILVGLICSIIWGLLSPFVHLNYIGTSEELNRFSSATTYVAILYLITVKRVYSLIECSLLKRFKIGILLSIVLILISWNRTTLFGVLLIILLQNVKNFKSLLKYGTLTLFVVFLLVFVSYLFGATRIINSFSLELIISQLANRFLPVVPFIEDVSLKRIIFGYGFGTLFFIPWFSYRGLESYFNFIDNTYLTFFVKYGIFIGGAMLMLIIKDAVLLANNDKSVKVFMLILFFTVCFPYQISAIGFYVGLFLINKISNKDESVTCSLSVIS